VVYKSEKLKNNIMKTQKDKIHKN